MYANHNISNSYTCYNNPTMASNSEEDLVIVDFDLPFPVHISSEPLLIDVKGIPCKLRFEKVARENIDPRLRLDGGDFDLTEDRFGWVRYSKVNVSIPLNKLPPVPLGTKKDDWPVEISISAVNNFLAHYRELLNAPWIRRLNPTEVWAADVIYSEKGIQKKIVSHKRLHQLKPPIIGIDKGVERTLRERLHASQQVSPWKLLLLDAEDALSRGDTRLAVILGQTAIESAVGELLIFKFREKKLSLKDVRAQLDKKKALSYESAVEKATIRHKLTRGLLLATGDDLSIDSTLWYGWEVANATRVSCVHHGYAPTLMRARKVLNTYWQVFRAYLEKIFSELNDETIDWAGDSINALIQAFERTPSIRLSDLIVEFLPKMKKRVVLYDLDWLPVAMDRNVNIMSEDRGDLLAIWLDPDEDYDKNQMLIAKALIHFQFLWEGYPRTKVSDTLPLEVYRTGWELVSETLTQMVLRLPEMDRLQKLGFPIDKLAKESFEATLRHFLAVDYVAPQPNEVRVRTLPLEVMALYFSLDEESQKKLIDVVSNRTPDSVEYIKRLLKAVQETGYETREKCVELMVKCRDCLSLMDSCLVVDPKERLVYYSSGPHAY